MTTNVVRTQICHRDGNKQQEWSDMEIDIFQTEATVYITWFLTFFHSLWSVFVSILPTKVTSSAQGSLSVRKASWRMPAQWACPWLYGSCLESSRLLAPCVTQSWAWPSPNLEETTPTSKTFSVALLGESQKRENELCLRGKNND